MSSNAQKRSPQKTYRHRGLTSQAHPTNKILGAGGDPSSKRNSPFKSLLLVLSFSCLSSGILLYQVVFNAADKNFLTPLGALGFFLTLPLGWIILRKTEKKLRTLHSDLSVNESLFSKQASQLGEISQRLSSGATEAASSLQETAASIEELSSMVKLNADHAREASALSINSRQAVEEGERRMQGLHQVMREISASSKKIEDIIDLIDDIAFQTNLLALNAAVEAARAGENGKGFAVVAEAVRTLAQKSASAAKEISTLIRSSTAQVERGVKSTDLNEASLREILISVKKVSDLNDEIAGASREQAGGIEQISKAINQLDQATQLNAASAEQSAATASELNHQSLNLGQFVLRLEEFIQTSTTARTGPARHTGDSPIQKEYREHKIKTPPESSPLSPATVIPLERGRTRKSIKKSAPASTVTPENLQQKSAIHRDEELIPFGDHTEDEKPEATKKSFEDLSGF